MKLRLFQYLVEQHNYRTIAFEMDFAEALIFNDYVHGRLNDNLVDLMREKMIFWVWRTEEVRQLLEWMRSYNDAKPDEEHLSFYGFDVQFPRYNARMLVERLEPYDADFAQEVDELLKYYRQLDYEFYTNEPNDTLGIKQAVDSVYQLVQDRETELSAFFSAQEHALLIQLARTIVQTQDVLFQYQTDRSFNYRDLYMAENTGWLLDYLGEGESMALWAHNFHMADFDSYGAMGKWLKERFDEDYQVVGFSFSTGYFISTAPSAGIRSFFIEETPKNQSINQLFHLSEQDNFILLLDQLPNDGVLKDWLSDQQGFLSIGSLYNGNPNFYYTDIQLTKLFDVMIHFEQTLSSDVF